MESFINVDKATNPTSIELGRTDDGYSGGNTSTPWEYTWIITGSDGYSLSGSYTDGSGATGDLPTADELYALLPGDYTVTTTAIEYFPMGFENIDDNGDSVNDTTTANFKVTVGNVIVEHLDADTNDVIHAPTTITGTSKGDPYTTSQEYILGYELVAEPTNKDVFFQLMTKL